MSLRVKNAKICGRHMCECSLVEERVHHVDEVCHALVDGAAKDAGVEVLGAALHLDEEVADAPEAVGQARLLLA